MKTSVIAWSFPLLVISFRSWLLWTRIQNWILFALKTTVAVNINQRIIESHQLQYSAKHQTQKEQTSTKKNHVTLIRNSIFRPMEFRTTTALRGDSTATSIIAVASKNYPYFSIKSGKIKKPPKKGNAIWRENWGTNHTNVIYHKKWKKTSRFVSIRKIEFRFQASPKKQFLKKRED